MEERRGRSPYETCGKLKADALVFEDGGSMTGNRLCALALSAGIQQRQLDLVESQANQIVAAMLSLLMSPRLGLDAEQIIEGRIVAAGILTSLPAVRRRCPYRCLVKRDSKPPDRILARTDSAVRRRPMPRLWDLRLCSRR
jgi:hypothetical protein